MINLSEQILSKTQLCVQILLNGGSLDELPKEKTPTLADVLNEYIGKRNIAVKTIAELSGINNSTIHRILNNEMHPSRNTLLRLAFILKLTFEDTQVLLKAGNRSLLSSSRERDRIIMQGIVQKRHLGDINEKLKRSGFNDLLSKQD